MSILTARKTLEKELAWMKGQVERVESVLSLLKSGNGHRKPDRRQFKHSPATKRKIAASQRKRFAAARR